jgi:formamidopyrimidine-DNA glycosylase
MPELPEVEAARRAAQKVAAGRRISEVWVADDPIVFEGVAPARFRRALVGRRVKAVRRHGKHLWLELDRRPWPCLHFGMTGGIHVPAGRAVRLVSDGSVDRPDWPPRFTKLHPPRRRRLALADGRLGRIRLRHDPPPSRPSPLGFDAAGLPTPRASRDARADAPIKAVLLDQSFAAGIALDRRRVLYRRHRAQAPRQHALPGRGGRLRRGSAR